MKRISQLIISGTVILTALLSGCKNNLLPDSIGEEVVIAQQDTSGKIDIPQELKATKGKKQQITLNWNAVAKASKYNIYAAKTPFESFIKIGETTETEFIYSINAGLTRYFRITAADYLGNESDASSIVSGATLARPLISNITNELTETSSTATVYWYMENVSDYQEMVRYEITAYENSKRVDEKFVDGSQTTQTFVTFENVPQHTNLEFQVTAYLSDEQSDTEISEKMDVDTAAKQTPDAVSDLQATWASSLDSITLSFKLPEPSFIKTGVTAGNTVYEQYPVYFKVLRRETSSDTDWQNATVIADHLYYDGTTTGHGITFDPSDTDAQKAEKQENINLWFNNYISGTEVSFTDSGLPFKTEYEYRIQSYLDNYKTTVTSNLSSIATVTGHTAAVPSITTKDFEYEYAYENEEDPEQITSKKQAHFGFNFNWEDFGTADKYKIILQTTKTGLAAESVPEVSFKQISDISSFTESFIFEPEDYSSEGYYEYAVYIVENSIETTANAEPSSYLTKTSAPGKILISPVLVLPEIKNFRVTDGYKDKIHLEWDTAETITYSLSRYEVDGNNVKIGEEEKNILTAPGDCPAESGKRYVFILTASDSRYDVPSDPLTAETLGTPVPVFDTANAKHNAVSVSWPKVQKASSYTVSFSNGVSVLGSFNFNEESEGSGAITEKNGIFTCTLSEPAGYNNASLSGKTWTATVTASNSTADETFRNTDVFTLGPAAVKNLSATVAKSTSDIKISWDSVPGAKAYAVRRARCSVTAPYNEISVDVYTVPAAGGNVKAGGVDVTAATAVLNEETGTITLTDSYKQIPSENPSVWDSNQDKLAWGFPYKYTVFPMEEDEELDTEAGSATADLGTTSYTFINADEISDTGSCIGYGHNVTATKAEDPKKITVTWNRPFGIPDDLEPFLWYRESGNENWTFNNIKASKNNAGLYNSFVIKPAGADRTKAFEYAVTYIEGNTESAKPFTSYLNELQSIKDETVSPTETLNKGYAFAIDFEASPVLINGEPSLDEEFTWKLWDYSKRAVGPDENTKYTLCLKNNDFFIASDSDNGWRAIADVNKDGTISTSAYAELFIADKYNISVTPGTNKVTVSPVSSKQYNTTLSSTEANKGVFEGLLKVQRDYKHYAKLSVSRTNSAGEEIEAACSDKEEYAYRNLTDGELARMALMTLAYGFYLNDGGDSALSSMGQFKYGGANNFIAAEKTDGQSGSATFTNRESAATLTSNWGKYRQYFTFLNYNSSTQTPGNTPVVPPLSISCAKSSCMIQGDIDNYIYCIETDPLKLSTAACGDDYSKYANLLNADLSITAKNNDTISVSIKRSGASSSITLVSTSDNGTRKWWFPMQIHSDKSYLFTSTDYGWWPSAEGGN